MTEPLRDIDYNGHVPDPIRDAIAAFEAQTGIGPDDPIRRAFARHPVATLRIVHDFWMRLTTITREPS